VVVAEGPSPFTRVAGPRVACLHWRQSPVEAGSRSPRLVFIPRVVMIQAAVVTGRPPRPF